jgi:hypothetical protein
MCVYSIGFVCAVGWFLIIRNVTITVATESLNNLRIMLCHPCVLICVCMCVLQDMGMASLSLVCMLATSMVISSCCHVMAMGQIPSFT